MIISFFLNVLTAHAHIVAQEWRMADQVIHSTCKNVNSPSELIVSYESQSVVVEYSLLLAHATVMGMENIRVQTERERLTAPEQVEMELHLLSQSVLVSMHSIQEQAEKLDLFVGNLTWFQQTTEQSIFHNSKAKHALWRKLCHTQARQTSKIAWQTYKVIMEELTKLQIITVRVDATLTLTLATAT